MEWANGPWLGPMLGQRLNEAEVDALPGHVFVDGNGLPPGQPASLTPDEVYAVLAHLLVLNNLHDRDVALDAGTLSRIEMPNRHGFRTIGH